MRPKQLLKDNTLYWVLNTYNTATGILADADSTPTVAVRKNGSSVGDSVTVTKRSATTGIYDCSYNPSGEVEGDQFTIVETVVMSSVTYVLPWEFSVLASVGVANDRLGYLMAAEIGACADAGTSAETYAITVDGSTYTIDHTGLDATGNRGTATLTKT